MFLTTSIKLKTLPDSPTDILKMDHQELARILTLQEAELVANVHPSHFMSKIGWGKKSKNNTSIDRLISRFNQISSWVTTEILLKIGKKQQLAVISKFIKIAKECDELNNFNSVMEIISGLNNFAIQRMRELWNQLPPKLVKIFEYLENVMDTYHNYKNYFHELANRKGPIVPYFGLLWRNFTVSAACNTLRMEDGSINMELIRILGQTACKVENYQGQLYNLYTSKVVSNYLLHLYSIDDEELLFQLSLRYEPAHEKEAVPSSYNTKGDDTKRVGLFIFVDRFRRARSNSVGFR